MFTPDVDEHTKGDGEDGECSPDGARPPDAESMNHGLHHGRTARPEQTSGEIEGRGGRGARVGVPVDNQRGDDAHDGRHGEAREEGPDDGEGHGGAGHDAPAVREQAAEEEDGHVRHTTESCVFDVNHLPRGRLDATHVLPGDHTDR